VVLWIKKRGGILPPLALMTAAGCRRSLNDWTCAMQSLEALAAQRASCFRVSPKSFETSFDCGTPKEVGHTIERRQTATMRRFLRIFVHLFPWAVILLIAAYVVLGGGWKDIILGRYEHKAMDFFSGVGSATEVKIYRLEGTKEQSTTETFPIKPYGGSKQTVYGSITLTGDELEAFLKLWRSQIPVEGPGAKCHEPPYGFCIYDGFLPVRETSICWGCSNFYLACWPFGSYLRGFDSRSAAAIALLDFCDKRLPYARLGEESTPTR
jgi:hypothetical protein